MLIIVEKTRNKGGFGSVQTELEALVMASPDPTLAVCDGVVQCGNEAARRHFGVVWKGQSLDAMFEATLASQLLQAPIDLFHVPSVGEMLSSRLVENVLLVQLLPMPFDWGDHRVAARLASTGVAMREVLQTQATMLQLLQRNGSEAQQGHIDALQMQTMRLLRLVSHIDELTHYREKTKRWKPCAVVLSDYLSQLADKMGARLKDVALTVECRTDDHMTAALDTEKLELALLNLVANAVCASDGQAVTLSCCVEGTWLVFAVSDNGCGFDFSAEPSIGRTAGLGLELVDAIVLLAGGQWQRRNKPEGGAEVTLRLPYREPSGDSMHEAENVYEQGGLYSQTAVELSVIS